MSAIELLSAAFLSDRYLCRYYLVLRAHLYAHEAP